MAVEEEEGEGLRELPVLILMESCGMSDLIQKLSRPATDEKQPGTRGGGYFTEEKITQHTQIRHDSHHLGCVSFCTSFLSLLVSTRVT